MSVDLSATRSKSDYFNCLRIRDNNNMTKYIDYDPIEKIERILREVIHTVLSSTYGEDWYRLEAITPQKNWHIKLNQKRENEVQKTGSTEHYDWLIAYSDFSELGTLLEKNKIQFIPVFGNYEKYIQLYKTAEELRNTIKHHRNIKPHQYHLLNGIAGEFEDIINIWRIGNTLEVNKIGFQFIELIKTTGKSDSAILSESTNCINQWAGKVTEFIQKDELIKIDDLEKVAEDFQYSLRGNDLEFSISTSNTPNSNHNIDDIKYKSIVVNVSFPTSSLFNIDNFLDYLDKPYKQIEYELSQDLDLERLLEYGRDGGINLQDDGYVAINKQPKQLVHISCNLINGKLRIGVTRYIHSVHKKTGGKISAAGGTQINFWQFHRLIKVEHIIRFIIGDIAPRTIIHLFNLSQIRQGN